MTDIRLQQDPNDPNVWVVFTTRPKSPEFKPWNGFAASFEAMARTLTGLEGKGLAPSLGVSEGGKAISINLDAGSDKDKCSFNATLRARSDGTSEVVMSTPGTPGEKAGFGAVRASGPDGEQSLARGMLNWLRYNGDLKPEDFVALFAAAKEADQGVAKADKPDAKPAEEAGPAKPGA